MNFWSCPPSSLDRSTKCSHTWELSKVREVGGHAACPAAQPDSPSLERAVI